MFQMKIPLPESYSYMDIADVTNETLHIHKIGYFQDLMYDLTYALAPVTNCHYCNKPLSRNKSTLDHMYPRYLGGPTIPNNLIVSCMECNSHKSNLNAEEFAFYNSLKNENLKSQYFREITLLKHFQKKWYSPVLPKDWLTDEPVDKIIVYFFIGEGLKGKSYTKIQKTYQKYGHICRPIIVDKNLKLLDGFNVLLFAKNNSITTVPTIILENVELD